MALIANLVTAVLSRIIGEEIVAWNPWLCRTLVKLAVTWVPENLRARLEEEWQSHVIEKPGSVGKLFAAADFLRAAHNLAKTNRVKAEKLPVPEEAEQINKEQEALIPLDWLDNCGDNATYLAVCARGDREAAQMRVAAMSQVASEQVFPHATRGGAMFQL